MDRSFDFILAGIALIVGIMLLTGHGDIFLKGGNTKLRKEKYDEKKMCKDYGKRMMLWPITFVIGAVIDYAFPMKGMLIAWIIWAVMLILLLIERNKRER